VSDQRTSRSAITERETQRSLTPRPKPPTSTAGAEAGRDRHQHYRPPDPTFAREIGANPVVRLAMAALSYRIRRRARRHQVTYSYLFIQASGDQLRELAALIDAEIIRPVVDSVFDFGQTREALAHLEQGHTKAGKVVIRVT
jgi:hypothetical protein